MVMSTCAHGYIVSIDTDEALHMPGVVSYISVDDVIGNNSPDAFHNREVFSTKEVGVGTKRIDIPGLHSNVMGYPIGRIN